MKKRFLAVMSCIMILILCIGLMVACKCSHNFENGVCTKCGETDPDYVAPCDHVFVDGVCTKCGETDPNYVAPKKDYDMSGVKFENKTVFFNGKAQTLTITGALPQGVTVSYAYYGDAEYKQKVTEIVKPGTYYVVASFTGKGDNYNPIEDKKATLTINKADYDMSGVKLENQIVPYSGEAQTLTVTGTLPTGVTVSYVYATDEKFENTVTEMVNVGKYYVKASFEGQEGYNAIADMTATLTISKLNLPQGVTFNDKQVDYDGQAHSLTVVGDLPSNISVSYKFFTDEACENEVTEMINAGVYYVQATLAGDDNYDESIVAKLTINKINVAAIEFANKTETYNGTAFSLAIAGDLPTGVTEVKYEYYTDEACTNKIDAEDVIDAGVYYVKAIFTVESNYNAIEDKVVTLTINKKEVNIAFANQTVTYNGEAQAVMTVGDELPEGVTGVMYEYYSDNKFENVLETTDVVNAGTYYVKAIFSADDNHSAETKQATLTINKAEIEDFDADSVEFTVKSAYGEEAATTISAEADGSYIGGEFNPGRVYTISATVADYDNLPATVEYFTDKSESGELTNQVGPLSKATMTNYTDAVYVRATFSSDANHASSVVKTVKLSKYTVRLKTYDDLLLMRAHIYGDSVKNIESITVANRRGIIYSLENDIDCNNALWTPVTYVMEWENNTDDLLKHTFCSEFNGNGHTISNYRITDESINVADIPTSGNITNTVYVGFFGRVNNGIMYGGTAKSNLELEQEACNIHDVTFSNVTIKFDANDPNYTLGETKIVAGIVVGYTDTGNQHTFGRTNLYNITVENCVIDIDAYTSFAGGIIGEEHLAHNNAGLRYNLNVRNCSFYAISSHSESARVYVGGLVGRWHCEPSGTPDINSASPFPGGATYGTRYLNCSVSNIKLGYKYEEVAKFNDEVTAANDALTVANSKVEAARAKLDELNDNIDATEAEIAEAEEELAAAQAELDAAMEMIEAVRAKQAPYLHVMGGNLYAGVFFGSAEPGPALSYFYGVNAIAFKNCSASNYLIAHTSPSTWSTGMVGYIASGVNLVNFESTTTHENSADWNDGINGVYGVPNDNGQITQQNSNEEKWGTPNGEWCTALTTEEENFTLNYLGLID